MFYGHSMKIVETGNWRFTENEEINGSIVPWNVEIKEVRVRDPLTYASSNKVSVPLDVIQTTMKKSSTIMSAWFRMNLL